MVVTQKLAFRVVSLALAGGLASGQAQAVNLITNGDFATNTFTGWTVTGATPSAAAGYADLHQDNNLPATVAELIDQNGCVDGWHQLHAEFRFFGLRAHFQQHGWRLVVDACAPVAALPS